MSLLGKFKEVKGFKQTTVTICNMEILFIEPSVTISTEVRKNNLKVLKGDQNGTLDYERSDLDEYSRAMVMATAFDPETNTRLFKSAADYDSVFGDKGSCGEQVLAQFLNGAKAVMKEEPKHNRRKGDKKDESTEGNS